MEDRGWSTAEPWMINGELRWVIIHHKIVALVEKRPNWWPWGSLYINAVSAAVHNLGVEDSKMTPEEEKRKKQWHKEKLTYGERTNLKCPTCRMELWRLHSPEGKVWLFCYNCYERKGE